MRGDNILYIWHAAVAEFQRVTVAYLVEGVVTREAFVDCLQELVAYVGSDV